jgi:hypothetical protein
VTVVLRHFCMLAGTRGETAMAPARAAGETSGFPWELVGKKILAEFFSVLRLEKNLAVHELSGTAVESAPQGKS